MKILKQSNKPAGLGMAILYALAILVFLVPTKASAGNLYGVIIDENGKPLVRAHIVIEGDTTMTNGFGKYTVSLRDGERELRVRINGIDYSSESVRIFSPRTKQNWRIEPYDRRLIKIR